MELYINNGIDGYILPSNPCEFDNINMTWIFTQVDSSVLNLVTDNSYFETIPCQLLTQLPWLLQQRDLNYLISDDYWFGDDPQCDTITTANNLYNITECDYVTTNNNTNTYWNGTHWVVQNPNITESYDECPNDDRCYYPFVRTRFESDKLKDFGMCHCQESCKFRFYGGDIEILDIYNQSCCWISLIFIIGYFINLFLEYKNIRRQNHKIKDLPLVC